MTVDPDERPADSGGMTPHRRPVAGATDAVSVESLLGHARLAGEGRRVASVGLPGRSLPRLTPVARECLSRLPVRQRVESVAGVPVWLPRLGVTVLPHELVGGGWLCTMIGADAVGGDVPGRLPTGVFLVEDVEVATALTVCCGWAVVAGLSAEEFRDAWQVRLATVDPRYHVGAALLTRYDRNTLTVTADDLARRRSGYRTATAFRNACVRLAEMGFLVALDDPADDPADALATDRSAGAPVADAAAPLDPTAPAAAAGGGGGVRYGLRLPRPGWPR